MGTQLFEREELSINIPKQIKVGGVKYKVKLHNALEGDIAGKIVLETATIHVLKGDPQFMQATFFHEVLHAINMEMKEESIEFLAQALNQVIVDNPHMFEKKVGEQKK